MERVGRRLGDEAGNLDSAHETLYDGDSGIERLPRPCLVPWLICAVERATRADRLIVCPSPSRSVASSQPSLRCL